MCVPGVGGQVVHEAAAAVGNQPPAAPAGAEPPVFPHLYDSSIDPQAVVRELPMVRDASGRFLHVEDLPGA